jgi:serine/threonine-protein phosphatase 2A regulatory subunit A
MPTFVKLTKDDQDSVRLLTVEDILKTTSILTVEESKQHLLPILKTLGQDKSWRVRSMVATHYAEVSSQGKGQRKRNDSLCIRYSYVKRLVLLWPEKNWWISLLPSSRIVKVKSRS